MRLTDKFDPMRVDMVHATLGAAVLSVEDMAGLEVALAEATRYPGVIEYVPALSLTDVVARIDVLIAEVRGLRADLERRTLGARCQRFVQWLRRGWERMRG